jgi:hypothetical protein
VLDHLREPLSQRPAVGLHELVCRRREIVLSDASGDPRSSQSAPWSPDSSAS